MVTLTNLYWENTETPHDAWNVGTSSSYVDVQDTVKDFLSEEGKTKGPLRAATEGKNQQLNPPKPTGH